MCSDQFVRWLVDSFQVKFSWFQSQEVFHKRFSPNLYEKTFLSFRAFDREKKVENPSLDLVVGGRRDQLKLIFFSVWFMLHVTLRYHEKKKQYFSYWHVRGDLKKKKIWTQIRHWVYRSVLSTWLRIKNSKWIIAWWSHHTRSINFLLWSSPDFGENYRDWSLYTHWFFRLELSKKRLLATVVECSLFNSYYTKALLLFLDFTTLRLIRTLYCWVLSKEVSSTTLKVFGMTRSVIEPRSPGPLANHWWTLYPLKSIFIHLKW